MRRIQAILLAALLPVFAFAQRQMDREMEFLLDAVCELRNGNESTFNRVRDRLSKDELWTPMNETGAFQDGECAPYDHIPYFRLNRLLNQIAIERKPTYVHGDMLNGEKENYDFSLYERSVHAGASVSYTVRGREGKQCFAIVPYDKDGGDLSVTIAVPGTVPVSPQLSERGIWIVFLDDSAIELNTPLTISVKGGKKDQSFVILNHNTRRR